LTWPRAAQWLLLVAFFNRVLIPAGFMPGVVFSKSLDYGPYLLEWLLYKWTRLAPEV
jgi:hypothetical protein